MMSARAMLAMGSHKRLQVGAGDSFIAPQEPAAEVEADDFGRVQGQQRRSRVAAERRAVVPDERSRLRHDLPWRDPLNTPLVAEDRPGEERVVHRVIEGMADGGNVIFDLWRRGGDRQRAASRW